MPRYRKGSKEEAIYNDIKEAMQDVPRKTRQKVEQPSQTYAYPTLTLRQTQIILRCIEEQMGKRLVLDDKPVDAQEWQELLRALFRA